LSTLADDVASIAKHRREDPAHLARSLRGDLDWIVMKAMEKNRARRYETAKEFAIDVRRHLDNQPGLAGPPGRTYRMGKFLRRNRVAVSAGTVVAVGLVIALSLIIYGLVQARKGFTEAVTQRSIAEAARDEATQQRLRTEEALQAEASQRQVAQSEASRARAVTEFLTELLAQTDPQVAMSPDITVRSILDSASVEVGRSFNDQPEAEARVRTTIGQAYTSLGEPKLAEPHLRRALAIREQLPETSPAEMYATLHPLTGVLVDLGHPDLITLGPRTIEVGLTVIGETRPDLSATLGQLFSALISGQRDRSDRLFTQVVEEAGIAAPGDPVWIVVADTLCADGYTLWRFLNTPAAAKPFFHEGLRIYRRELPAGHPRVAYTLSALVTILNSTDQYEEAELLVRESSDILRGVLPEDHWHIALADSLLGECLLGQDRFAEAEALLLASHEKIMAAGSRTATAYDSFGRLVSLYESWGRPGEAAAYRSELARTIQALKLLPRWTVVDAAFGLEHRELVGMLEQLKTLGAQSRTPMVSEADLNTQLAQILADFLPKWRSSLPPDHALSAFIARQLNFWVAGWDGWADMESRRMMVEESLPVLRHWQLPADTGTSLVFLAASANGTGAYRRAEGMAREAWSLMRVAYGDDTWFAAIAAREVGRSLLGQERYAEAEPYLVDSYAILVGQTGEDAGEARWARRILVDLYVAWDKPDRARPYVRTTIEGARRTAEAPGASADDKNTCAWNLLTCDPADLRDPETALRLARQASAMTNYASPPILDTLALAQHLTGDTAAAIETEKKALSLLPADSPARGDYEAAIARFEATFEDESR
jgi:tetratricopeptide (TPR) repeat protein